MVPPLPTPPTFACFTTHFSGSVVVLLGTTTAGRNDFLFTQILTGNDTCAYSFVLILLLCSSSFHILCPYFWEPARPTIIRRTVLSTRIVLSIILYYEQ